MRPTASGDTAIGAPMQSGFAGKARRCSEELGQPDANALTKLCGHLVSGLEAWIAKRIRDYGSVSILQEAFWWRCERERSSGMSLRLPQWGQSLASICTT